MHYARPLALLGLAVLAACGRPATPGPAEGALTVVARPPYLVLENTGERTVHHAVFDADVVDRVMWLACADPSCPGIDPGARDSVHYDAIGNGEHRAGEAVVYWWHVVEDAPGEFAVDSMRDIRTAL